MRFDKFTVKAQEAVMRAQELAQQRDHSEVLPLHLLAALLAEEEGVEPVPAQPPGETHRGEQRWARARGALPREGKTAPVAGRAGELRRTIQVLSRRPKNTPVLIGEPGVGKTAIVEGLAMRILNG